MVTMTWLRSKTHVCIGTCINIFANCPPNGYSIIGPRYLTYQISILYTGIYCPFSLITDQSVVHLQVHFEQKWKYVLKCKLKRRHFVKGHTIHVRHQSVAVETTLFSKQTSNKQKDVDFFKSYFRILKIPRISMNVSKIFFIFSFCFPCKK